MWFVGPTRCSRERVSIKAIFVPTALDPNACKLFWIIIYYDQWSELKESDWEGKQRSPYLLERVIYWSLPISSLNNAWILCFRVIIKFPRNEFCKLTDCTKRINTNGMRIIKQILSTEKFFFFWNFFLIFLLKSRKQSTHNNPYFNVKMNIFHSYRAKTPRVIYLIYFS